MSNIKKYFTSRWENGKIVEMDFSQLEIIVLAHLSQDPQMMKDIRDGIDMHCVRAAQLFRYNGLDFVTQYKAKNPKFKDMRTKAKELSFQLQYGAGAPSMAETTGLPLKTCKDFIEQYYNRYPKIKEFQEKVAKEVQRTRVLDKDKRTKQGIPAGKGVYKSQTGRRYVFTEYDNDYKKGAVRFSSTQMKNYPVQGLATADIVPMILGKVFRALKNNTYLKNHFLMINTVHDSIIFDVYDEDTVTIGVPIVKEIMESAPRYLKELFDIDFDLPLGVDVEIGDNWMEIKEYKAGQ